MGSNFSLKPPSLRSSSHPLRPARLPQGAELGRTSQKLEAGGRLDVSSAVATLQLARAPWLGTG